MSDLVIGVVLIGLGAVLLFLCLPKGGVSPKFLQFYAAPMLFPAVILALLVMGIAELLTGYYGIR